MQFQNDHDTYFSGRSVTASYSILIPGMNFTCDDTITRVTVGGVILLGNQTMKLRIWRETAANTRKKMYRKSDKIIDLVPDICEYENNSQYTKTCQLMDGNEISVGRGDILGIELPPSKDADFELHSVPAPPLMNYIFEGTNLSPMVNLNDRPRSDIIQMTPLIFIMLRRDSGTSDQSMSHVHLTNITTLVSTTMSMSPSAATGHEGKCTMMSVTIVHHNI